MTADEVRAQATRVARAQARGGIWSSLLMLALAVLAAFMVRHGGEAGQAGWALLLLCGPCGLFLPLAARRGFRRPRWAGGRLAVRGLATETAATIILCTSLGGLCLWAAWLSWTKRQPAWTTVFAVFGMAILGMALPLLGMLFDTRPKVIVDEAGYFDRRQTMRPIPWDRIERLAQGQLFANGQNRNRRLWMRLSALLGVPGFGLRVAGLDCTLADLLLAIHHYAPRLFEPVPTGVARQVQSRRNPTSRHRSMATVAVIAGFAVLAGAAWAVAWRVDDPSHRSPGYQTWQAASASDCEVMAVALRSFEFARGSDGPPLIGKTSAPGPCNWPKYGLRLHTLTTAQFMTAFKGAGRPDSVYIEHIALGRPKYSLLRLRAAVEIAHLYGPLGADGYVCHLLRGSSGWRLQDCRETWLS